MDERNFEDLIRSLKLSDNQILSQFRKILNIIFYYKKNKSFLDLLKQNQFKNINSILLLIGILYVKAFKNEKK